MIPSFVMPILFEPARRLVLTTWPSALVALAAWLSVAICVDPAGSYPSLPEGPGLTVDEIFNVEQGVYLVEQARELGWYNLIPGVSIEAFRRENGYNPDHPPLGRYWLGFHHQCAMTLVPPDLPDGPFVAACARFGSATAFALTIWLVGAFASAMAHEGRADSTAIGIAASTWNWDGLLASLALVLMPRVYGHAHLASLETVTNLTCSGAVLCVAWLWRGSDPPRALPAGVAGVVMGLALLTKIQAVLIPIPIIVMALLRWRLKAIAPIVVWGITAVGLFFLSWPYLWQNPIGHLLEYLGRTTNRVTLYCFYLGTRYADKAVPWHYPFVMFAVTVPVGLHLLGLCSALPCRRKPSPSPLPDRQCRTSPFAKFSADCWQCGIVLACLIFPLIVFAMPGVAVYDGERLFLTVFPLWAVLIGRGAARLFEYAKSALGRPLAMVALALLVAIQAGLNCCYHPVYLSYYNELVGGRAGAENLGMEMNYWGDAVTRSLLRQATQGNEKFSVLRIAPSLHQFQEGDLLRQSPILRSQWQKVTASERPVRLTIAFRRRADLSDEEFLKLTGGSSKARPILATFARDP